MVVKIYCDVCGALIPEAGSDEGVDAGQLLMGYGPWGERLKDSWKYFDFDALCKECAEKIREAIEKVIEERGVKE